MTALDPGPQATAPTAGDDDGDERSTRRRRRPGWRWPAVAVAVAVGAAGLGVARLAGGDPPPPAMGPGDVTVEIDVEHSLYATTELRVVEGTRVRFVVVNGDPIAHELIVGDEALHARHRTGTHVAHPSVPGEVSVAAGDTAVTTQTFDEPGTVEYACHLPGHYEYGMHGEIEVVPAA